MENDSDLASVAFPTAGSPAVTTNSTNSAISAQDQFAIAKAVLAEVRSQLSTAANVVKAWQESLECPSGSRSNFGKVAAEFIDNRCPDL